MKKFKLSFKYLTFITLVTVSLNSTSLFSQNTTSKDTIPFTRFGNISTKFTKGSFELEKGNIVSNVLKVVNHELRTVNFKVDALFPAGWSRIDDANKTHVVKGRDTVNIPIIIAPTKLVNGNTEIIVNVFVVDLDGSQIGNNFFTLSTKKKVAWSLGLKNNTNYYFKNDENKKRFNYSVNNDGNYKQDIFINYVIPRKDLKLQDTTGIPLKKLNTTFTLEAGESREFHLEVEATELNERNKKRVSINNYTPYRNKNKVTRSLIINSSEPKIEKTDLQRKTKVNFIKLPNEIEVNPYGYPNLPLIVDLNAQNILDDRSFLSLNLQGFKQLDQNSNLVYFAQFNYSNSFFTNNVFKNAPWYVGYFDEKKSIEVGQVSGNLIGTAAAGKGIKGSYKFNEMHTAGAFYTNSNGFAKGDNTVITYGGWYHLKYNENLRLRASLGHSNNKFINRKTTVASLQPRIRIQEKHNVTFLGGISAQEFENQNSLTERQTGFIVGASYGSTTLKRKLRTNFSTRFNDRNFSNGRTERILLNERVTYDISKDWMAILAGNYQNIRNYNSSTGSFLYDLETLNSNLIFTNRTPKGSYQPGIFYEYRNFPNSAYTARGLSFRYSIFDLDKNMLSSIFTRAGYARPKNEIAPKEYFSLEASALFRYRTWNVTARYNLGTFSSLTSQRNVNNFITPQSLRVSLQNQYLLSNRHFLVESSVIYSYNNVFSNHTVGLFPQFFYFSDSGWRFGLSANYVFSTSDFSSVFDVTDPLNQSNIGSGPTTTSNLNLNFSLRKEFGVPLPFTEKIAANAKFITFLDVNGNGIKDNNESAVQNVVIKLNREEVITNPEGEALMKNVPYKKYKLETLPLEELNGWFSNVADSLIVSNDEVNYIPFVRGIKVYGDVIVDRQKIAIADDKPLDLSRIKITAVKGDRVYNTLTNANGRFEFYLPFGSYTITMDEGILNDRFNVTRNNLPIRLRNNQDGVYVSFYIVEKRRKVNFKDFTKKNNN